MKRILLSSLFAAALMCTAPVFADLEVPGETNPVLSENSIVLNEAKFSVIKRIDQGTVTVKVLGVDGKEMWASLPLGEQEKLREMYPRLGDALKQKYAGWNCYFFTADTALAKGMRLSPSRKTPLFNGKLECRLYEYKIVAGSNRRAEARPSEES